MTCGKDPGTWITKTRRTTCVCRLEPQFHVLTVSQTLTLFARACSRDANTPRLWRLLQTLGSPSSWVKLHPFQRGRGMSLRHSHWHHHHLALFFLRPVVTAALDTTRWNHQTHVWSGFGYGCSSPSPGPGGMHRAPSSSQAPSHAHNRSGGLTRKTGWNNLPSPSKATRNSAVESCLATEVTGSISSLGWMCQGEAPKSRSVFSYDSEMGECQSLNTLPKRDGEASIWAENRNQLVVLLNYLSIGKLCDLKNLHIPSVSFTISMHPNIFNMLFVNCHLPVFLHPPE